MTPRRIAALVLCATALLTSRAGAQQVSEADRANARALAQKGQEALEAKDYAAAADAFAKANAIIHAPTLMLGLAEAQIGLGKLLQARELLEQIARDGAPRGSPASWTAAIKDAQKELAALLPRIPTLTVTIAIAGAPSADVKHLKIDGAPASPGAARPLDPGAHTVRAEADGYKPAESTVTLAEGRAETVALTLVPLEPLPQPEPAKMPLQKILGFAAIGVGGASLLAGVGTGIAAVGKHASLADVCPNGRCKGQQSAIDGYTATANASTATLVIGAAFAAAGVTLVLLAPKPRAESTAWIAPAVGFGSAGLQGGF